MVTELFIRGREPNSSTHYFITKIPRKQGIQQIALVIHQILTLKISLIFTKNVLPNDIFSY